jgi:hypothetical protein
VPVAVWAVVAAALVSTLMFAYSGKPLGSGADAVAPRVVLPVQEHPTAPFGDPSPQRIVAAPQAAAPNVALRPQGDGRRATPLPVHTIGSDSLAQQRSAQYVAPPGAAWAPQQQAAKPRTPVQSRTAVVEPQRTGASRRDGHGGGAFAAAAHNDSAFGAMTETEGATDTGPVTTLQPSASAVVGQRR